MDFGLLRFTPDLYFKIKTDGTTAGGEVTASFMGDIPITDKEMISFNSDSVKSIPLVVNIVPKQSGSGDPSPSNVRPISGWDSVGVNRYGKNYLPINVQTTTRNGVTFTVNDDGTILVNGTATATIIFTIGQFTLPSVGTRAYTLSGCPSGGSTSTYYLDCRNYNNAQVVDTGDGKAFSSVGQSGKNADIIIANGATCNNLLFKPMIRLGTDSAYFEKYNGSTITTNLPQTVYGGTLDVVSGVLTSFPYYSSYSGQTLNGEWICDRAVYSQSTTPPTGSQVVDMSGTGTEIQLTPTEVKTLLGSNNIWSNAGTVSTIINDYVKYKAIEGGNENVQRFYKLWNAMLLRTDGRDNGGNDSSINDKIRDLSDGSANVNKKKARTK